MDERNSLFYGHFHKFICRRSKKNNLFFYKFQNVLDPSRRRNNTITKTVHTIDNLLDTKEIGLIGSSLHVHRSSDRYQRDRIDNYRGAPITLQRALD